MSSERSQKRRLQSISIITVSHLQILQSKYFKTQNIRLIYSNSRYGLDSFWTALSINYDHHNLEYISSIEAKKYPFVGVQFHPEKNIFEWNEKEPKIPHSR